MSQIYDALKKLEAKLQAQRDAKPPATPGSLDAIRIEQFLDLQQDVLLVTGDPRGLPDRLAQRVAIFLRVVGAAIGVVDHGRYRVVGTYGSGSTYGERLDGRALEDAELGPALVGRRPLVLRHPGDEMAIHDVVLPFRAGTFSGALHLVVPEGRSLSDESLQLARALSGLVGVALANAQQSVRPT